MDGLVILLILQIKRLNKSKGSIARGEHIATIRMCGYCHTETLSGQSETVPGLLTLTFPNLTAGAGGVGATNTDEDWVRAIRHGVGHDGRGLVTMPARFFTTLAMKTWARSTPLPSWVNRLCCEYGVRVDLIRPKPVSCL
jgi:hypothetical protein